MLLNTVALYATGSVSLSSPQFLGDSGDSSALLGQYKGITDKAISIAFVIAAVPVLWSLATNAPRAKKAVISYIVAIIVYYGVIEKII